MNSAAQIEPHTTTRIRLGLYNPLPSEANSARWRINGYPVRIVIWTAEEWEQLAHRPADAQYFACGVWCALRVD